VFQLPLTLNGVQKSAQQLLKIQKMFQSARVTRVGFSVPLDSGAAELHHVPTCSGVENGSDRKPEGV
jgi:hypothetical protein